MKNHYTSIKKETLVDDFCKAEDQSLFKQYLNEVLENEADNSISSEEDKALLCEFRKNFDWEEEYGVTYEWDFGSFGVSTIDYSSREEMMNYLRLKTKPMPPKDFDDIFFGDAPTGKYIAESAIYIDNLRLKKNLAKE